MLSKIINIILGIVCLFLLITCIIFYLKVDKCNKQRITAIAERDACWRSPVKIDTIHDTIHLPGGIVIRPIPIKVIIHDTVFVKLVESWYDSTYIGLGWRFRWRAYTLGTIEDISFSDFVIPKEIITYTKTVDTCLMKNPEIRSKSHLWAYFKPGVVVSPFKVVNATVGLQYTRKDKWGVGVSGGYDWDKGSFVAEGMFLINIK